MHGVSKNFPSEEISIFYNLVLLQEYPNLYAIRIIKLVAN